MDIQYLLLLQNFRESTNNLLSPFMLWISSFSVGFWPFAFIAMIYWASNRKVGKRLFAGFGLSVLCNGILKLTFRITRPWLRDDRVLPYGDSKVSATGYSFPSGHATFATSLFGAPGVYGRKKHRVLSALLLICAALVLFSRNYLGVHTPQDVLVGTAASALMVFLAGKIEDWTDADPKRDYYVLALGLALCALSVAYFNSIHIEPLYDEAGTLVVDPVKMVADSYEGAGSLSAFVICRVIERRCFFFDTEKSWKDRFIIGVFALIPLYYFCNTAVPQILAVNRSLGRFVCHFGIVFYVMCMVPFVMSKIHLEKE